jgi:predicted Zn finger-like uncharacterized protein
MNVTCPNCLKKYALPDGAVLPGVQVRVRCKGCENVFTVTNEMAAAAPKALADDAGAERLAEIPDAPGANQPSDPNAPPGEMTRHFIAQSGANKRNPPWKIALFIVGGIGLPLGVLFMLSTLGVGKVTVTNEQGEEVEQPFFSAEGVSGLGDLLSGKEAQRRDQRAQLKAAAEKKRSLDDQQRPHGTTGLDDNGRRGGSSGKVATADVPGGSLGGFYGGADGKKDIGPKVRGLESGEQVAKEHAGGLDEGEAAKVVGQSQPAFQSCIETALRRNPNLKVGKIKMTVTVGPSGAVKSASIAPKQHDASDWGTCLKERARRMVFPKFPGDTETDLEVPLVVGVSL